MINLNIKFSNLRKVFKVNSDMENYYIKKGLLIKNNQNKIEGWRYYEVYRSCN